MDFTVEYYETVSGRCPVREFLDGLEASDPDDFAAVFAGLGKLRSRQTHREPLSRALGDGFFEFPPLRPPPPHSIDNPPSRPPPATVS